MDGNGNQNFTLNDTQPFDSQNFPASLPGGKRRDDDEVQVLRDNVLFDDTVPVEDEFETQVVDLGDDTVPVEDTFETQVVDFGGETQVLDYQDCLETQLIDEFNPDSEGTDNTEVLDEPDGLSDGDSHQRGKSKSSGVEMFRLASHAQSKNNTVEQHHENHCSGSVQRFTSIRAASLPASGLADWKNNGSNTEVLDEADQKCDTGRDNDEVHGLLNGKPTNFGCSTVRELFGDNNVREKEAFQLPTCDDGLAGLSYIDSQEPGDSSQANAFACVQRLIEESRPLIENESDLPRSNNGKSNFISTAKGPQSLAKKTKDRGTYLKSTIFDWDDGREDEGGGDFFRRRKEEFFGERSSATGLKAKGNQVDGYRDCKGKSNAQHQNKISAHPDFKTEAHSSKLNDKRVSEIEMNGTDIIVNDFDEESDEANLAGQSKASEVLDIGLDTQMAAEAMEDLFNGDGIANLEANGVPENSEVSEKGSTGTKAKKSSQRKRRSVNEGVDIGLAARQSKKKRIAAKSSKQPPKSSKKQSETVSNKCGLNGVMTRTKRTKADAEGSMIHRVEMEEMPTGRYKATATSLRCSVRKSLPEEVAASVPIAYRTRKGSVVSKLESAFDACKKNGAGTGAEAVKVLDAKGKPLDLFSIGSGELENLKPKSINKINGFSFPKRRRSSRRLSDLLNIDAPSKPSNQLENTRKSVSTHTRSLSNSKTTSATNLNKKMNTRSSITVDKMGSSSHENREKIYQDRMDTKDVKLNDRNNSACLSPSVQDEVNTHLVSLPEEAAEPSKSACTSPVDFMTPINAASPVCLGDGYLKESCRRNLSRSFLMREIGNLAATQHEPVSPRSVLRKRRDLANARILFSQHLDDDIVKQQRKIADRLKVSIASNITEATHFIADKFVRTRNMLEAIASGKPVVTRLWLENIGRAKYYIDEQKYILQDVKKEKELGFSMPITLALACQRPLLQGRRVLITPNSKPSKEINSSLVQIVGGQVLERVQRSVLKDVLILSCEEDYEVCVPFLEKGAAVYSSELLLNGIVTQKLEYERHQLFAKRTRSTIWLKTGEDNFIPVPKQK